MPKLTKRSVEALEVRDTDYFVWDSELACFGVRVMRSGRKSFLVQYRSGGRTRRVTIAPHGVMTPEEARKEAKKLLGDIAKGENPAEDIHTQRRAPTIGVVCDRFMTEYVPVHCKESTAKEYGRSVELFIKPAIGAHKISDITRTDITKVHNDMREKPYQANRTLGVLSKLFNLCEVWGLRADGSNPCRHVKKYKEEKRERYLTPEEIERLGQVLAEAENTGSEIGSAINAYRLLLFTGCRLGEVQTLKWSYIKGNVIELPDSKTGKKKIYLGQAALECLANIDQIPDNPYVITGKNPGQHLNDLQHPWRRIREKAGITDVRIHDLRHTFASFSVGSGDTLYMTGKLLGHTNVQTTARYAHLADDPMRSAAERTSGTIADALNGTGSIEDAPGPK
ncbi:MAG: tyrosine-type recombinase/integrase [Rhodospirillales bacterium]|jgi:integrase|nr:tyrosine-type recombinase/integrase [Rhodospirillales bacterium]